MSAVIDSGRRRFLTHSAGAAAGLIIGFNIAKSGAALAQAAPPKQPGLPPVNAYLSISPDNIITIQLAHSEMGQGIWTTLPMLLAEELDCDWTQMRMEHAPAAIVYAHTAMGIQMTGGSTSTWSEFDRYRQVGAAARDLLLRAGAAQLKVPAAKCSTERGYVLYKDQRLSFGSLATAAAKLPPPTRVKLKDPKDWKIIGKPTKRLDSPEKVTGEAEFGMDVRLPGLMTAVLARPPVFGGKAKSVDDSRAKAVPGVHAVVTVPSGVAVVAENFWAAKLGRDALNVDWDLGPGAALDTEALRQEYRRLAGTPGLNAAVAGDMSASESAKPAISVDYELPFLAHAPMEPLNCTAKVGKDSAEVWIGTQFPGIDQGAAAETLGMKPEQVKINTTFLGGAFGRRATGTCHLIRETVAVAKAAGVPVKVVWTREDDIRGGYYRPQWLHRAVIHTDSSGLPRRWDHTVVGQSILANTPFASFAIKNGIDESSIEGTFNSPYVKQTPVHRVALHSPASPVPVLWWRSVGHSHTAFVMESLVDELAHAANQDPVDYRRKLLTASPRHARALNLAAEKAGWGSPLPAGRARGIAVHESFGSWVAHVAEVSVENNRIHVHRVVVAIDCGICVNPEGVAAQMESCVVYGLSAALYGRITLKDGRVQQSNFHDYQVMRLPEMPVVETYVVASTEKSGGAGEPGLPPIAPAVANAVYVLTKKRLRSLPLDLTQT